MQTVLADLSDAELVSHVRQLLVSGAKLEVETLLALNVIHKRKLYRPAGCGSFHVYCVDVLRMSDDTASRRSRVGKLLRLYPALVRELIETQVASVTALSKLEPVITDENAERLLNEVRGKTVREVELMVVREVPKPAVQSGFRTVFAPALTLNAEQDAKSVDSNAARHLVASGLTSKETIRIDAVSASANTAPPRSKKKPIEPRAVDHYAFSANMNETTKTRLKQAMDVGNFESYDALFAAAVDRLLAQLLKKKHAQVAKPRKKVTPPKVGAFEVAVATAEASDGDASWAGAPRVEASRVEASRSETSQVEAPRSEASRGGAPGAEESHAEAPRTEASSSGRYERETMPAAVLREVFSRDGGRCTFEGTYGRCTETRFIAYHHRLSVALGGESTVENLTLHCREHNVYQAVLDFGAGHMSRFVATGTDEGKWR